MPHRHGDPLPQMTENQKKVFKAYGSIPAWLDECGRIVCQYCNGAEKCNTSCLFACVMDNVRLEVRFLDAEEERSCAPVTPEEMEDNFHAFCFRPDVSAIVSGEQLFEDFMLQHRIVVVLQALGPWLRNQAHIFASTGGADKLSQDRLLLKCERAVLQFLRLDLNALSHEDTVNLSNVIESAGLTEAAGEALMRNAQKAMDLISIAYVFHEMQGKSSGLKDLAHQTSSTATVSSTAPLPSPPAMQVKRGGPKPTSTAAAVSKPAVGGPIRSGENGNKNAAELELTRCRGRTQSGARCKLTAESVQRLHGRCAEAAKPLATGAKFCKFHRSQEFQ